MMEFITQELINLKKSNLFRETRIIEQGCLLFCSNDYLGLTKHPLVIEKSIQAIKDFGFGAGASRLISGSTILHEELEHKLAKIKNKPAALVFSTGYMANLGAICSLVDENDTVIIDRLNHASIIDACRLSKAKLQVYPHNNTEALDKILKKSNRFKKRLIVTDHVFSMDGDIAPLGQIAKIAKKYQAITLVDTAHAIDLNMPDEIDVVMGTLSKTYASLGGFIAGSKNLVDYLKNKARSFIYTTALPPAACAASLAAIQVIEQDKSLVAKLKHNTSYLREKLVNLGFDTMGSQTQIIPILIKDTDKTVQLSKLLLKNRIFVPAIRWPTVPKNTSRLRVTVTAQHQKEDLDCLVSSLQGLTQK